MYFWLKNKKLKSKNLPTNPIKGGIPAIDKKIKTVVNDTKLYLFKTFRLFKVLIFFRSYKKSRQKNIYSIYMYIYIFIYIIDIP